jgi:hypothetical protein
LLIHAMLLANMQYHPPKLPQGFIWTVMNNLGGWLPCFEVQWIVTLFPNIRGSGGPFPIYSLRPII